MKNRRGHGNSARWLVTRLDARGAFRGDNVGRLQVWISEIRGCFIIICTMEVDVLRRFYWNSGFVDVEGACSHTLSMRGCWPRHTHEKGKGDEGRKRGIRKEGKE